MSLKLTQLPDEPVVVAELDRRTAIDHRMRLLDRTHVLRKVIELGGMTIEFDDRTGRRFVRGLKCDVGLCGAEWHDAELHPAVEYDTRHASYPNSPAFLRCTVCGGDRESASKIFPRLFSKHRAKVLDQHFPSTKLLDRDFTIVRAGDKQSLGENFKAAADKVAPKRFDADRDFEAILIRASSAEVALAALQQEDFPADAWVVVPVTHELWPKAPWHRQAMSATDAAPIAQYQSRQRREAAAAVEAEVKAFGAQLRAQKGVR